MKKIILCILFFTLLPRGNAREILDREWSQGPQSACNQRLVAECQQNNRVAAGTVQSWIEAGEPRFHALAARVHQIAQTRVPLMVERSALGEDLRALTLEMEFLRAPAPKKSLPLISGALSLEDFFHMEPLQRSWRERYPAERAEKLSKEFNATKKKESELNTRLEEISAKLAEVNSEFQSVLAQKNSWLAALSGHEFQQRIGCQDDVCTSRR